MGEQEEDKRLDYTKDFVEGIACGIQCEKFHWLKNNCFHKSFKFRKHCRNVGIKARVALVLCIQTLPRLHIKVPIIHGYGVVDDVRYEVAHKEDWRGKFGNSDLAILPILGIWI